MHPLLKQSYNAHTAKMMLQAHLSERVQFVICKIETFEGTLGISKINSFPKKGQKGEGGLFLINFFLEILY